MNYFTKETLISTIKDHTTLIELGSDEGSVIISEFGGRVLGLFPKKSCYNLLWVNPKIKDIITSRNWQIGGDRFWISPERDFFYKNPETWEDWFCPEGLDPANYEILASSETSCTISSGIFVTNQRTKQGYQGEITRQFKLINESYSTGVQYCGLEILDDCVFYRSDLKINGWSLAQVISGGIENPGTVLIQTKSKSSPISYFASIPNERLKVRDNYVAFKVDVNSIYKLAIRPEDIDLKRPAKIGYILKIPNSEDYSFLVKGSFDIPESQEQCYDVSRAHPDGEIGVIQTYNSESPDKNNLMFGEIELQLNPFKTIANASHGKAKHQLFGYIGTKDEILRVVEKHLGISNPELF